MSEPFPLGQTQDPGDSEPLTYESVMDALGMARELDRKETERRSEGLRNFYASIPEEHHDAQIVNEIAHIICHGVIIHPLDKERLSREMNKLLSGGAEGAETGGAE